MNAVLSLLLSDSVDVDGSGDITANELQKALSNGKAVRVVSQ